MVPRRSLSTAVFLLPSRDLLEVRRAGQVAAGLLDLHRYEVSILGRRVDCFYFTTTQDKQVELKDIFEREKRSTGESRFRMAHIEAPKVKVPKGARKTDERDSIINLDVVDEYVGAALRSNYDKRVYDGLLVKESDREKTVPNYAPHRNRAQPNV